MCALILSIVTINKCVPSFLCIYVHPHSLIYVCPHVTLTSTNQSQKERMNKMKFLYYQSNGTYAITRTNINDILSTIQPDDIIDGLNEIGIQLNRFFENMDSATKYVLWINQTNGKASLDLYKDSESEDAEEFQISPEEINQILEFFA